MCPGCKVFGCWQIRITWIPCYCAECCGELSHSYRASISMNAIYDVHFITFSTISLRWHYNFDNLIINAMADESAAVKPKQPTKRFTSWCKRDMGFSFDKIDRIFFRCAFIVY